MHKKQKIMMNRFAITILGILLLLVGCASNEEKLEKTKSIVDEINEELKVTKGKNLFYSDNEIRSRFTYYLISGEVKFINEEMFTETGHFLNLYYFESNKLIFLDGKSMSYIPKEGGFNKKPVKMEIYFDNSVVLEAKVIESREIKELSDSKIGEVIAHAKKLYELSREHLENKE
jgi:hypothetical protein